MTSTRFLILMTEPDGSPRNEFFFTLDSANHLHEQNIREGKQSFLCEIALIDAHPHEEELTAGLMCLLEEDTPFDMEPEATP